MNFRFALILSMAGVFAAACTTINQARAADQYEIDAAHTRVQFSVRRFGFNDVIGVFGDVKGVITLDQEALENSSVEVEISIASLNSGDESRDEALASEFWFNGEAFPKMTFHSTAVEQVDETSANVTGDLTLLGVTKPVVLHVAFNKLGTDPSTRAEAVGFSATATLDRQDFGMETAANFVGNDIAIRLEVLAHKIE